MKVAQDSGPGATATIRTRLLFALAIALAPVLVLGVAQTVSIYSRDLELRRHDLIEAAQRSASVARARIESGAVVLETLTSETVGLQCGQNLRAMVDQLPGYESLIRFDSIGRISCASGAAPMDLDRRSADWFVRLQSGQQLVVARAPDDLAPTPSILAVVRSEHAGVFDGAMAAVIGLESLRPDPEGRFVPGSKVALVDRAGAYASRVDLDAFPASMDRLMGRIRQNGAVMEGRDRMGRPRLFSGAPLAPDNLYVVASAPAQTLSDWSRVNLLSTIAPPLLAFILAVLAVWFVTDRVVVRWLNYLQRIASIYARGRFTVRAIRAAEAPPEIAELAATLDAMADAILERDASLNESLEEKDRLMREIHHRVKNNLQIISSLLAMQLETATDPATQGLLQESIHRVRSMGLIHERLYQSTTLARIDFGEYARALTGFLFRSYDVGGAVELVVEAEATELNIETAMPCGLILNELVSNALKYAFKEGRAGKLLVAVRPEAAGGFSLTVRDTGPGLPPDLDLRKTTSLGMRLVTSLTKQIKGKLTVQSEGGASFRIDFEELTYAAR